MGSVGKNFFFWLIAIILLVAMYDLFSGQNSPATKLAFSDFLAEVEGGQVSDVQIEGRSIEGHYNDGSNFTTYAPEYPGLVDKLQASGVKINAGPPDNSMNSFWGILIGWFPILLLIGVWIFFMRQMQSGGGKGGAMGFGKSRARMMSEKTNRVTFEDVAGIEEAKDELGEIVDFLKDPQKFQKLGGKIPKGCLLVGPPGTGKTLLGRAIAGEANVPFFTISGSEFVEMFVGVGASRVRDMFEQAKKNAPCIVFIDEIDAVGRHRGAGLGGGNDEREQTLNQLLVEMDGFESNEGVIILAATNRPDVLDPALLRPGRFDRQIVVPKPDIRGREQILHVHMKKIPLAPDVDAKIIARGTPGFSGADLANLVNEAALLAARNNKKVVTMKEMEEAKDKVMMGTERKSMVMTDEEKELTAYHEAGHAIVGLNSPASDPIHKATIIPRGRALGMVMRLPERDVYSVTFEKLKADIAVAMGGRVAEELIFGTEKVTSGASSDIKHATHLAENMVRSWGMSDKLGPIDHANDDDEVFLGHSIAKGKQVSDRTADMIDDEVKRFVDEGHARAKELLEKHMKDLHTLAKGLLEYETLTGDEIKDLLAGKKINKTGTSHDGPASPPKQSALPKSGTKKPSSKGKKKGTDAPPDATPEGA